ncbi:hypothetical protein CSOJ01_13835 [Colletotrichum sojae]|uniref:N-acetyltransferase domain-containing protein n=1 Tax=Colletotrichum sojae TaxID=2175907 RepID=A0A8H6IRI5_9PEZI|nr:hypothetical protein CSOJ01_13835 [Colletotrichum sojae]
MQRAGPASTHHRVSAPVPLQLLDLVGRAGARRHGYAKLLLRAMASAAREAGCVKMDWVCLSDNAKALRSYDKLGARGTEDWVVLTSTPTGKISQRMCLVPSHRDFLRSPVHARRPAARATGNRSIDPSLPPDTEQTA